MNDDAAPGEDVGPGEDVVPGAGPDVPAWLRPIADAAARAGAGELAPWAPPADGSARESAVLLLFGETDGRPDLLLTQRATGLRRHAGQVAFPGGVIDPGDHGPVGAALREAREETGLEPSGIDVLAVATPLWIPITNFSVTPVVAWWREPCEVRVVDATEVASVHRVALDDLLDPANRFMVRHPSGTSGPAFRVDGLVVWGFTAIVLTRLFEVSGIARAWDRTHVEPLPAGRPEGAVPL
ncbi:MAG TPA: CoA pyrophosphatase [Jiangellaceae bacterium]